MHILDLLEAIRAIAQTGLNYEQDHYNRERYERLIQLTAGEYATLTGDEAQHVAERLRGELGYITPKIGCAGVVTNEQGHLLLVKRSDNGRYGFPGGYAEVGLTPQDNVRREIREETGLEVCVDELINVFCTLPGEFNQPHTVYGLYFACTVTGGTLTPSHETPEVGFYDHTQITHWHMRHAERAAYVVQWLKERGRYGR